jgi:hypothetical protein
MARGAKPPEQVWDVLRVGADRIIAMSRVMVAALSLCSVLLDPVQPLSRQQIAYGLLGVYLLGSLAVFLGENRRSVRLGARWSLPLHVGDIIVLAAVVYLTEATTQAVFGFYIYLLLAAHFRWRWKGTLWTAAAVMSLYLLALCLSIGDPAIADLDIDGIIVRIGAFAIATAVLVYFGQAEDAAYRKILAAIDWPTVLAPEDSLAAHMEQSARVLGVDAVALLWVPDAGSAAELVLWSSGRVKRKALRRTWVEALLNLEVSPLICFTGALVPATPLWSCWERARAPANRRFPGDYCTLAGSTLCWVSGFKRIAVTATYWHNGDLWRATISSWRRSSRPASRPGPRRWACYGCSTKLRRGSSGSSW